MSNQELENYIQQMDQHFLTYGESITHVRDNGQGEAIVTPIDPRCVIYNDSATSNTSVSLYREPYTSPTTELDIRNMIEELTRINQTPTDAVRDYVVYTGERGYENFMSITRTTTLPVTGGPQYTYSNWRSQIKHKNYTVSENLTKNKNQIEYVLTTKSGVKISKVINNNMIEKERLNLSKGRVLGYKPHTGYVERK